MLPVPDHDGADEPGVDIDALVTVTLDDLDEGHLTIEAALRVIAVAAWRAGRAAIPAA